jgi:hypothetical protein
LEVALDGGVWATAGSPTSVEAQRAYVVGFIRIPSKIGPNVEFTPTAGRLKAEAMLAAGRAC